MNIKLRRSVLFIPGANPRMLSKVHLLTADVLILDLEDSVGPHEKIQARDHIRTTIDSSNFANKEIVVRVNSLSSEWGREDVAQMCQLPIQGLLFPKIENGGNISQIVQNLSNAGAPKLPIWLMIETPSAILNIAAIASASEQIECLMLAEH